MRAFLAKLRFAAAYTAEIRNSESHVEAVRAGFTTLSAKAPFNVLSEAEIKKLAPVVALIPDLPGLIAFIVNIVKQNDATPLQNAWFLGQLRKQYQSISAKRASKGRRR